jgi:hypothetical protein
MSTVEQIDQLLDVAKELGYQIRYDYFGGTGGGVCEFSGKRVLFMDLALTSVEQLELLESLIAQEPLLSTVSVSDDLKRSIMKRAA